MSPSACCRNHSDPRSSLPPVSCGQFTLQKIPDMNESRLPWWLVLLLGVWIVALSAWGSSRAAREVRWGAGLLSLVYLALIFFALGGDPRALPTLSAAVPRGAAAAVSAICAVIALLVGLCLLGQPTRRGRLMGILLFTIANGVNCFAIGVASVGGTVLVAAIALAIALVRELGRDDWPSAHQWLRELIPVSSRAASNPMSSEVHLPATTRAGLAGATGIVLALLLVGTLRYAMRFETSRAVASHRFSALPSAERVRDALQNEDAGQSMARPFELLLDQRADVIVLLTVLAFLGLAMHNSRPQNGPTP